MPTQDYDELLKSVGIDPTPRKQVAPAQPRTELPYEDLLASVGISSAPPKQSQSRQAFEARHGLKTQQPAQSQGMMDDLSPLERQVVGEYLPQKQQPQQQEAGTTPSPSGPQSGLEAGAMAAWEALAPTAAAEAVARAMPGGIVPKLVAGFGTAYTVNNLQRFLWNIFYSPETVKQTEEYLASGREVYPGSTLIGQSSPMLMTGKINLSVFKHIGNLNAVGPAGIEARKALLPIIQRSGLGGSIMGGIEGFHQFREGNFSLKRLLLSVGIGMLINDENKWAKGYSSQASGAVNKALKKSGMTLEEATTYDKLFREEMAKQAALQEGTGVYPGSVEPPAASALTMQPKPPPLPGPARMPNDFSTALGSYERQLLSPPGLASKAAEEGLPAVVERAQRIGEYEAGGIQSEPVKTPTKTPVGLSASDPMYLTLPEKPFAEVQQLAKDLGLPPGGSKSDIVGRIRKFRRTEKDIELSDKMEQIDSELAQYEAKAEDIYKAGLPSKAHSDRAAYMEAQANRIEMLVAGKKQVAKFKAKYGESAASAMITSKPGSPKAEEAFSVLKSLDDLDASKFPETPDVQTNAYVEPEATTPKEPITNNLLEKDIDYLMDELAPRLAMEERAALEDAAQKAFESMDQKPSAPKAKTMDESKLVVGSMATDSKGNTFRISDSRYGMVTAHPVIDGNPVVNRDSAVRFAITDMARQRNPGARTDLTIKGKEGFALNLLAPTPQADPLAISRNPLAMKAREISIQNEAEALKYMTDKVKKPLMTKVGEWIFDVQTHAKNKLNGVNAHKVVNEMIARQGATPAADHFSTAAVNDIKAGLPEQYQFSTLAQFLDYRRTVEVSRVVTARGKDIAHHQGLTPQQAQAALDEMKALMPPKDYAALESAAEKFDARMRANLDLLHEAGTISDAAHAKLIAEHKAYVPRQFIEHLDPVVRSEGGKKLTDSGIDALAEGSEGAMVTDWEYLLRQSTTRVFSRAFKNRANMELVTFARDYPSNGLVREIKTPKLATKGEEVVMALDGGKEVYVAMERSVAESFYGPKHGWTRIDPSGKVRLGAEIISGTLPLKMAATQYNPFFGLLRQIFMDIPFAWMQVPGYSRIRPIGLMQQIGDLSAVWRDAKTRSGRYNDFANEGGLQFSDFAARREPRLVAHSGAPDTLRTGLTTVGKALSYYTEIMETTVRLATRERFIKGGMSPKEASIAARDMMDFVQGGYAPKFMDAFLPYTNAAVQGTRGLAKAYRKDPVGTLAKSSWLIAEGYAVAWFMKEHFGSMYDEIDDMQKVNNHVFPLYQYEDSDGNNRVAYIAVARDPGQRILYAIGASLAGMQQGKPWDMKSVTRSMSSMFPEIGADLPMVAAYKAYADNYDTYRDSLIWRGRDVDAHLKYDAHTSDSYIRFAQLMHKAGIEISPMNLEAALGKLVPYNSALNLTQYDIPGLANDIKEKTWSEAMAKFPGVRVLFRTTKPTNKTRQMFLAARRVGVNIRNMSYDEAWRAIRDAEKSKQSKKLERKHMRDELQ